MMAWRGYITQPIVWLVCAFIVLGVVYTWASPPFESSDEYWHFGMIEYIYYNHSLPVQDPENPDTLWKQEGSQPPLYYGLAALLMSPFDMSDIDQHRILNPHSNIGHPDSIGNKNFVMHDGDLSFDGAILPIYLVRGFSILLGAVSVIMVYASARLLAADRPVVALLAAGWLAFNPMFLFISASMNNDNLVIALTSMNIYLLLLTLRDGFNTRRSILLAILIALATLTKLSGLVIIPVVACAGLWIAYRDNDFRGVFILGVSMIIAWAVIAGWWYLRNIQLYGELFGTTMMVKIAGPRLEPFTLERALAEFKGFRWAFWGVFGVFDLRIPYDVFYAILDALMVISGLDLLIVIVRLIQHKATRQLLNIAFLCAILIIGFTTFLQWNAQTYASQGRLLFPYVAVIMPLTAMGWAEITRYVPKIRANIFILLPAGFLACVAVAVPLTVMRPAYTPLAPIAAMPPDATAVYVRYEGVELIGYKAEDKRYMPGDDVLVTLYWHVLAPEPANNSISLSIIAPDGRLIGKLDTYPGAGSLQSSLWQAGEVYEDQYTIPLGDTPQGNFPIRLQPRWWNYETGAMFNVFDETGNTLPSVALDVGVLVSSTTIFDDDFTRITPIDFGGMVRLLGYKHELDNLTLYWETLGTLDANYTVFVQVLDGQQVIAQGDAPPTLPTRYWRSGEQYITQHTIQYADTPAAADESYPVLIGWYHPDDFRRLQVANYPDNAYSLIEITR